MGFGLIHVRMDVLCVDADTGEAGFYKSVKDPGALGRGGGAYICSQSFGVGAVIHPSNLVVVFFGPESRVDDEGDSGQKSSSGEARDEEPVHFSSGLSFVRAVEFGGVEVLIEGHGS